MLFDDKITRFIIFMINSLLVTSLTLSPAIREHVRYAGDSLFVSCRSQSSDDLIWLAPDLTQVTARRGALRVESKMGANKVVDLVLNPISRRHRGQYTCRSSGVDGSQETSFNLTVFKPISFRSDQSVQYATRGSTFRLRCDVSGDPAPRTSWLAVGRRLLYGPESKHDVDPGGGELVIRNVSDEDAGVYRCRATQVSSKESAVDLFDVTLKIQCQNIYDHQYLNPTHPPCPRCVLIVLRGLFHCLILLHSFSTEYHSEKTLFSSFSACDVMSRNVLDVL